MSVTISRGSSGWLVQASSGTAEVELTVPGLEHRISLEMPPVEYWPATGLPLGTLTGVAAVRARIRPTGGEWSEWTETQAGDNA